MRFLASRNEFLAVVSAAVSDGRRASHWPGRSGGKAARKVHPLTAEGCRPHASSAISALLVASFFQALYCGACARGKLALRGQAEILPELLQNRGSIALRSILLPINTCAGPCLG